MTRKSMKSSNNDVSTASYCRGPGSMQGRARGICGGQSINGVGVFPHTTPYSSHSSGGGQVVQ
jgi:hypothetical protein